MRYLFIACLLAGCMPGPSAETLVDELRVIAAVAEPPEVMPAETSNLEVVVADPLQNGAQVAVWACTPAGEDTCVEAGSPLAGRLATGTLDDGRFFADITVNPAWAAFDQAFSVDRTCVRDFGDVDTLAPGLAAFGYDIGAAVALDAARRRLRATPIARLRDAAAVEALVLACGVNDENARELPAEQVGERTRVIR